MSDFQQAQQAVEKVVNYYDDLIEQGFERSSALDFTAIQFGIERRKLVALLNDRESGQLGNTGQTNYGSAATPSTASSPSPASLYKPPHGDFPNTFPKEWV